MTKAGFKISDTNELKTLKEGDIARVGSDIYRRDLAKEEEIAKTINPADKDAFNKAVYSNTQSSNLNDMEDIIKIGKEAPGADGSIGADVLKDEEEIDFEEAETPMPIVPEVEEIPEMQLTPSEEKEVGLMDEISGLYEETLGRTAYRTGLEEQAGLPQMQETQRDLERQLKILANEAKQETLRIQDKPISNTMIRRQTEKMTRQNSIKALGLNSLLEASRGNISTATALVDRAVSAKYNPIEEEIAVKERNLQALKNSPQATIEDKNRAMKMEVLLDEQRTALADARAEKEVVMNLAIEAQMNGADSALTTAIQEADTRLEALEIGGELLVSGGWKYVSTPAERDRLIAQGYEITQTAGRTYMREPQAEETAPAQIGSISEQLKAAEAGYDIVDGKIVPTGNQTGTQTIPIDTSLSIGSGTITALNGSDFWKPGLDFVLAGGKGADVKSPFIGEVIFAGENGNFGNQVKIRTGSGEEIWLSHLDSINVGVGDQVNAESVVGKQGNTGRTYSTTGGDGTHLDITVKKPDGSFYSAPEVAGLLGYDGGSSGGDVEFPTDENLLKMNNEERQFVNAVMRQLPTKLKDSEQEKIERQKEALFDYKRGRDIQETIDEINGFVLDPQVPEPAVGFAKNLRTYASGTDLDLSQIASAVNYGNYTKAMTNVENANLEKADKDFSDLVLTQTIIKRADEATDLLDELGGGYSGAWDDVANRWIIKLPTGAGEDARQKAARIGAILTGINKDIRLRYLGSAVTETEAAFLENFLATMKDQPEIINTKLKELKADTLSRHNSARNVVNLPSVNEQMIINNESRLPLYGFEQEVNEESIENAPIGTMVEAEDGTVYEKTLSGWISDVEIIEPFN